MDERLPTSSAVVQVQSQHTANCTRKWKLTASEWIYQWIKIGSYIVPFLVLPNLNRERPIAIAAIGPLAKVSELRVFVFHFNQTRPARPPCSVRRGTRRPTWDNRQAKMFMTHFGKHGRSCHGGTD